MTKILAALSGWKSDRATIDAALAMAKAFDAFVHGVHIRQNAANVVPIFGEGVTITGVKEIVGAVEQTVEEQARHAKSSFLSAAEAQGLSIIDGFGVGPGAAVRFEEAQGYPAQEIAKRARLADFALFALDSVRPGEPFDDALNETLLGARRASYLALDKAADFAKPVVIAWDGSTEAANVMLAAKPFLKRSGKVIVAQIEGSIDYEDRAVSDCQWAAEYLRLSGYAPEVARFERDSGERTADALSKFVVERDAGLLAMGAYGHSRLREAIIGGVTVRMIEKAQTPLLLAH